MGIFFTHTHAHMYMHANMHGHTFTYVASLGWSCRKLICTTLKCISIKEKHIEVPGEERDVREREGGTGCETDSV